MSDSKASDAKTKSYVADVSSLESLLAALYDVISGAAGVTRDWDRFRNLCLADGGTRFIPCKPPPPATAAAASSGGSATTPAPASANPLSAVKATILTAEDYIKRVTPIFATTPFWEICVANRIERFGPIAHVFSTYESFKAPPNQPDSPAAFDRGINSIQAVCDGTRWYLVTIMWTSQDMAGTWGGPKTVPDRYLISYDPQKNLTSAKK